MGENYGGDLKDDACHDHRVAFAAHDACQVSSLSFNLICILRPPAETGDDPI
jgi:hypothetical protein